ncbi:MAG: methyltransferase family protein [Candidatus Hodarchaeota archaeon]
MHEIKIVLKNVVGISLYLVFYSVCLMILAPEILNDTILIITVIINYLILFIDTLIRPESEEEEPSRSEIYMALAFLLQPFLLLIVYYENKYFISKYLLIWDNSLVSYAGIIILVVGGIVLLVSRFQIGRYGSGKIVIEDRHELITNGIYGYVRHPIYLGGLIGWTGLSMAFRGLVTSFLILVMYFLLFKSRMDLEEQILQESFGEEYISYVKRTKRLVPFVY